MGKQINAEKVAVSGAKRTQKLYRRHSGRPGGMKIETFDQLQKRIPERIVEHAVRGMLPKGRVCFCSLILSLFNSFFFLGKDIEHALTKSEERRLLCIISYSLLSIKIPNISHTYCKEIPKISSLSPSRDMLV